MAASSFGPTFTILLSNLCKYFWIAKLKCFKFENRNKKEIKSIFDEAILIPEKEFMDVLKYTYDKKFNFLYIDTTKSQDTMLHKNFNKLLVDSPNIMKY